MTPLKVAAAIASLAVFYLLAVLAQLVFDVLGPAWGTVVLVVGAFVALAIGAIWGLADSRTLDTEEDSASRAIRREIRYARRK